MSKAWTTQELFEDYEQAGYQKGYEDAVTDAQEALTRLLTGSSLSFRDLQGMRLALTVIQQISPDTEQIPTHTGAAK